MWRIASIWNDSHRCNAVNIFRSSGGSWASTFNPQNTHYSETTDKAERRSLLQRGRWTRCVNAWACSWNKKLMQTQFEQQVVKTSELTLLFSRASSDEVVLTHWKTLLILGGQWRSLHCAGVCDPGREVRTRDSFLCWLSPSPQSPRGIKSLNVKRHKLVKPVHFAKAEECGAKLESINPVFVRPFQGWA